MYLDYAATTPLSDDMKEYLISLLDSFGNPSSQYEIGIASKRIIETARKSVSRFIGSEFNDCDKEIIFTSSASAANTLAINWIHGMADKYFLLYSPTMHKSVLLNDYVKQYGFKLKISETGRLKLDDLTHKLESIRWCNMKCFVCIEYANSEIGTIQDVKNIINLVHKYNGICFIDCTGAIAHCKINVQELGADMISFSGHKLGALKGCGVLYRRKDIDLIPIVCGVQENGLFGGTENLLGIASLGYAVNHHEYIDCSHLIWDLYNKIREKCNCVVVGSQFNRLNNNLFICFNEINTKRVVGLLDELYDIQVSTGSACNNYSPTPSSTLVAIGMDSSLWNSCLRITFSGNETFDDIEYIANAICECVELCNNK